VASILLVAIGSAMVLAGKAIPTAANPAAALLGSAGAFDRIAAEAQFALDFTERTSRAITFTVPDRTGDGKPETIRYAWSGSPGAPLTRRFNGEAAANLIDRVESLSFNCDTVEAIESYPGPAVESAEQLLAGFNPGTYTSGDHLLNPNTGAGQYFLPTVLPANALSYSVTRVVFVARQQGLATETLAVKIHKADAGKLPTGTALGSNTVLELSLSASSYGTVSVSLGGVTGIAPTEGLCLLIENALNLLTAGRVEYCANSGGNMLTATAGVYALSTTNSLRYQVFGKVVTPTSRSLVRTRLASLRVSLQTTGDPGSRVDSAIALANQPEALEAQWSADFTDNPTTSDLNGDGQPDWTGTNGFDAGTLSAGVWRADRTIFSNPPNSLTSFTTLDVAFRDSTATGNGAGVEMRVEATLLGHGIIEAYLVKQADGSQTLTVQTRDLLLLPSVLTTVRGLPSTMVNLRLHVNPADDSVGVTVNGVVRGTFNFNRSVDLSDGFVRLFNTFLEAGAEFDSVRVRVGGVPQ
jgi:hypothetical protein